MNQNDTLIQLVEQAACCVNMLGPSDLSDARQLEEILSRIDRTVHELDRGSDPLRSQMEGVTCPTDGGRGASLIDWAAIDTKGTIYGRQKYTTETLQ